MNNRARIVMYDGTNDTTYFKKLSIAIEASRSLKRKQCSHRLEASNDHGTWLCVDTFMIAGNE